VIIFSTPSQAIVRFSGNVTEANGGAGVAAGSKRVYTITATSTTSETVTIL
jgi:hypothetical protein